MVKKICYISFVAIICFLILHCFSNKTYAKATLGDIVDGGDFFTNSVNPNADPIFNEQGQKEGVSQLYFIALGIGIAAAAIVGMILGIQFVTTGVEGQAKIKEKLIPYIVGCVVIFGGFGIWRLVVDVVQSITD